MIPLAARRSDIRHREEMVECGIAEAKRVLSYQYSTREQRDEASATLLRLEQERDHELPSRRYWTGMSGR